MWIEAIDLFVLCPFREVVNDTPDLASNILSRSSIEGLAMLDLSRPRDGLSSLDLRKRKWHGPTAEVCIVLSER